MNLPIFAYKFNKGPISKIELTNAIEEGNCRLAIQIYFYRIHNLFIEPSRLLCPRSYRFTGRFVFKDKEGLERDYIDNLKKGDVIYAEKMMDKNNKYIHKPKKIFSNEDSWIISLHTAVYISKSLIWHATSIEGKSCIWPIDKFCNYYKPVAIKRILR